MAEAAEAVVSKFFDKKVFITILVLIVLIFLIMYGYHHFVNTSPLGSISANDYGQLTKTAQANYYVLPNGNYAPNGQTT